METSSRIRAGMAAGALAALAAVTGCAGAGSNGVAGLDAVSAVNGPYGAGGPFATSPPGRTATSGRAATGSDALGDTSGHASGSTVQVAGSTALNGIRGLSWLPALGTGIKVSAPQTVRSGTATAGDAEAGFYDAFYAGQLAAACGYAVPSERAKCPAMLAGSAASAGRLRNGAIGFVVAKNNTALVTMTGFVCGGRAAPDGCLGQQDPSWIFENSGTFDTLWARIAQAGGNPLTATPLRRVAGRWYVDLVPSASEG
jgi:hypothetical protein